MQSGISVEVITTKGIKVKPKGKAMTTLKASAQRAASFTSPHTQRSERVEKFREKAVDHLLTFDTRLIELGLGLLMLLNGLQVNATDGKGSWLAPFVETAFYTLKVPKPAWMIALIAVGLIKLHALGKGWMHDNCLRLRSKVSFWASMVWAALVVAIWIGGQPLLIVARYCIFALGSMTIYLILAVKSKKLPSRGCDD